MNSYIGSHYAHDVVLTSVRCRFNVMDVAWMSKRCRVLTGILSRGIQKQLMDLLNVRRIVPPGYSL